jgi:hypothetical protein
VGCVQACVSEWSLLTLPSPIPELQHAPLPLKVLWARECAPAPFPSAIFHLDSLLSPLKSWSASTLFCMFIQYSSRQGEVLQGTHSKYVPRSQIGHPMNFTKMLCLHTKLPFFKSFIGTIQFRSFRKGLLQKALAKTTLSTTNIKCLTPHNIRIKIDMLPSSLIDSNVSLMWKQRKNKELGTHFLACSTLGVEGHAGALGWD